MNKAYSFNINRIHFFKFFKVSTGMWIKDTANEAIDLGKIRHNCRKKRQQKKHKLKIGRLAAHAEDNK